MTKEDKFLFIYFVGFSFKVIHRPIQVQGKSRVDTWLRHDPVHRNELARLVKI